MEKILYLAHTQPDGTLPKAALEALCAAVDLSKALEGAALSVGLVGGEAQAAADAIAGCGAGGFFGVTGADFAVSRYASDAAQRRLWARQAHRLCWRRRPRAFAAHSPVWRSASRGASIRT